ncbi:MAG: hypothetical protein IPJ95_04485 [Gemmatimonadetes bacterium]|nr:hypothetical protein [Gemmatimonadota bacterium]
MPSREYSEQELDDAEQVIAQLARRRDGNGHVGMWGISWGGFNAIQVAMRQPPALKAILALHATDDLFHDDVHYIDGALHLDPYILQIDHENGLPRTPGYAFDAAYFRDRFDASPWVLTYLKQPADGPFWRRNGLRFRPEALTIPAYLIGGLLDGYRDLRCARSGTWPARSRPRSARGCTTGPTTAPRVPTMNGGPARWRGGITGCAAGLTPSSASRGCSCSSARGTPRTATWRRRLGTGASRTGRWPARAPTPCTSRRGAGSRPSRRAAEPPSDCATVRASA